MKIQLIILIFLSFQLSAQDQYINKIHNYRKAFISEFFNLNLSSESIYNLKSYLNLRYELLDSLEKPFYAEIYGKTYFKTARISFVHKLKKVERISEYEIINKHFLSELNINFARSAIDTNKHKSWLERESFFDQFFDNQNKILMLDSLHRIYLVKNSKNKFFILSQKSCAEIKTKVHLRDRRILRKNNYNINEEIYEQQIGFLKQNFNYYDEDSAIIFDIKEF
jgi:hypothetical protein